MRNAYNYTNYQKKSPINDLTAYFNKYKRKKNIQVIKIKANTSFYFVTRSYNSSFTSGMVFVINIKSAPLQTFVMNYFWKQLKKKKMIKSH